MNKDIYDLIEYPQEGIVSKVIIKEPNFEVTLFCMAKGTDISEHTSTKHGIVQVLEGKGSFNLEGKNIKMEKGVIINMPKSAIHSLKAKEDTSFLLTLIKNGK